MAPIHPDAQARLKMLEETQSSRDVATRTTDSLGDASTSSEPESQREDQ